MSTNLRTTIRDALASVLAQAGTGAATRVFVERVQAVDAANYPLIEISMVREQQRRTSQGGGRRDSLIERTLTLNVSYVQRAASGYYAAGDEAMRLIEGALAGAQVAAIKDIEPAGTLFDEESDGNRQLYTITQEFTVTYITTQGDPAQAY